MRLVKTIVDLRDAVSAFRQKGETIGLVPTMGALHDGHLSLMRQAMSENDRVVVSIFVNPLQFGPAEDFLTYPRDVEGDASMADSEGVDLLFSPPVEEIYPNGAAETRVEVGRIGTLCEGEFRPGHFEGVATVCMKLFNLVGPDRAYFGEKDIQQLAVIRQVVRDLDVPVEVVGCPTVREPDGLAMSSRNRLLDPVSRLAAAVIPQALFEAREMFIAGERSADKIRRIVSDRISGEQKLGLQYVDVVNPHSFEPLDQIDGKAILALAAFCGETRLIDNVTLEGDR